MSAHKNLETVYVASGQWEAQVVKSRLEAADIPVLLSYESVGPVVGITVDGLGEVKVMVPRSLAPQAKAILQETPEPPP
jgi:ABC-type Zn2+ transport system substrate-binding protein/surface adhesin